MLPSLSIVLKRIMSMCSAVVVPFYCCVKTLQYKKWSFLLLMDIWVASRFFFFFPHAAVQVLSVHSCTCLLVYTVKSFSKVYPGVSHRLCMSSALAENGKLFFKQTVLIYTPMSCVPPSLANTVRSPPHQSAPIWLPVIVSLCGFSFLISWWWMTLSTFSYICWPFGFRLFKSLVFILKGSMRQFQYHRLFVAVDNQSLR